VVYFLSPDTVSPGFWPRPGALISLTLVFRLFEGLIVALAIEPLILSMLARLDVFVVRVVGVLLVPVDIFLNSELPGGSDLLVLGLHNNPFMFASAMGNRLHLSISFNICSLASIFFLLRASTSR